MYNKSRAIIKIFEQQNLKKEEDFQIIPLTGDASARKYLRVINAAASYIVCVTENNLISESDQFFIDIQKFLIKESISVPNVFAVDYQHGLILQEDLGDMTLLKHLSTINDANQELEIYLKCIDIIVQFHKIDITNNPNKVFLKRSFDKEKLYSEIIMTKKYFLQGFLNIKLSANDDIEFDRVFEFICEKLEQQKKFFVHRDFHSRNIMVKDERFFVIDFQDARSGLPHYDLVSLLDDCYYDLSGDNKEYLLNYYWEQYGHNNLTNQLYSEFLEIYDYNLIQRTFKAIGTFSFMHLQKNNLNYLKYIGRAMENLRKTLMKYPCFSELRKIIFKNYYAT